MKFAHLADCHVGGWRDPKLREVNTKAFIKAADQCIERNVDFVLISGDLFNTSLPPLNELKSVVIKLRALKEASIPVYVIAGSHDFSPSGKTMIDILDHAHLLKNIVKGKVEDGKLKLDFTIDKSGAKIAGMIGKRGMLEKAFYETLDHENLENEAGFKIFMFHTALTEFKSKELENMDSAPLSLLPKGFDYYAGGHVHIVMNKEEPGYGTITYPGPLFPNNFKELEELGNGGFYIVEDGKAEWNPIQVYNTTAIKIDCNDKNPAEVEEKLMQEISNKEFINTIVTIRLFGKLCEGKVMDINLKHVFGRLYEKGAYFVMKSTSQLKTKEFEDIKIDGSVEDVEEKLIEEHLNQIKISGDEKKITIDLMAALDAEKNEGEKVADFEMRLADAISRIEGLDD